MADQDRRAAIRVGITVLAALAVLVVGTALIGEQNNLFRPKHRYFARFKNVGGLNEGNPVQLNGVTVGQVEAINLSPEVQVSEVEIHFSVDRRYVERIRTDSLARIRTLGLLGDKYVEITSGSPGHAAIPPEAEIPAAPRTDVDELVSSGEDAVKNIVAISHSLRHILDRVDRGEGLIGELTSDPETGKKVTASLLATMDSIQAFTHNVETGEGALSRLINDRQLGGQMASAVSRLDSVLAAIEGGDGILNTLLNDPSGREELLSILSSLEATSRHLEEVTGDLSAGDGLLLRLLQDGDLADELEAGLVELLDNLARISVKIDRGDGTAARLVNDPAVYDAVEDVVVGVDESRLLRWLVRNRQKAGIEKRYDETRAATDDQGANDQP